MSVDDLFLESNTNYGDNNKNSTVSPSERSISIIFTFHNVRISAIACKLQSIFVISCCFDYSHFDESNEYIELNVECSNNKKENNIKREINKIAKRLNNLLKIDNNSSGFITIEIYQNKNSDKSLVYKDFLTSNKILNIEKFKSSIIKTILQ